MRILDLFHTVNCPLCSNPLIRHAIWDSFCKYNYHYISSNNLCFLKVDKGILEIKENYVAHLLINYSFNSITALEQNKNSSVKENIVSRITLKNILNNSKDIHQLINTFNKLMILL